MRVTQSEHAEFVKLGGSKWLRKILSEQAKKTAPAIDSGFAIKIINRVLGR